MAMIIWVTVVPCFSTGGGGGIGFAAWSLWFREDWGVMKGRVGSENSESNGSSGSSGSSGSNGSGLGEMKLETSAEIRR